MTPQALEHLRQIEARKALARRAPRCWPTGRATAGGSGRASHHRVPALPAQLELAESSQGTRAVEDTPDTVVATLLLFEGAILRDDGSRRAQDMNDQATREFTVLCRSKRCSVELVVLQFTTVEAWFNACRRKMRCPQCGGILRSPDAYPLPEDPVLSSLDKPTR